MAVYPQAHTSDLYGPNLITRDNYQYAVMYTLAGEIKVCKWERGSNPAFGEEHIMQGEERLALGLPVTDDEHNNCVIAIDGLGYLHVWANMHNNNLRYVKSTSPGDISSWEPATLPGVDGGVVDICTYPMPVMLPDRTLFFHLRFNGISGRSDSYYWTLGPSATEWSAPTKSFQGLSIPGAGPGGTTGSDGSVNDDTNFSGYPSNFCLEELPGGGVRIHWGWVWRTNYPPADDPTRDLSRTNYFPSYAYTDDVGQTWRAIDGTPLTLPITPYNNLACQTGQTAAGGYMNGGGLALDSQGRPHIFFGSYPHHHIYWNGNSWIQEEYISTQLGTGNIGKYKVVGRFSLYRLRDELWMLGVGEFGSDRRPRLFRFDRAASIAMGGPVDPGAGWEVHADPEAYRLYGKIEVLTPDGDTPAIATFGDGVRMAAQS